MVRWSRFPSEWSVGLGFHLNGPLSRWNEQALVMSVVSCRHPPLGPSASGSPVSLPRLSARRTRTSNTSRTTHVTGASVSLHMPGHWWYRLRADVRKRKARSPGSPSASRPSFPGLPRPDGRFLAELWKSTQKNGLRKAEVTTRFVTKVEVPKSVRRCW